MSQPDYNPELEAQIPEPVLARCHDMNQGAVVALRTLETNYDIYDNDDTAEVGQATAEPATVTDLVAYKVEKAAHALPDNHVAVQPSHLAGENAEELDRLSEMRRLSALAHSQATPTSEQQDLRGLTRAG